MKLELKIQFIILNILILFGVSACVFQAEESERKMNFDAGWKFYRGHVEGAENEVFDDSSWRTLDLPHDWSVEPLDGSDSLHVGPFSKESAGGFATGQTVGGEGWYRKTFI